MEIRKSRHQYHMLNSYMLINDRNRSEDDTIIHENINNENQMKVSITTIQIELKQKYGRRGHV